MKNKILSFVFALCFVMPFAFVLTACGHEHTYKQEWTTNSTHHYHEATCEHAEEKSNYGEHVYTDNTDTTCNTCGYEREVSQTPTNAELSVKYKDIAVALWNSAEVSDPTVDAGPALVSAPVFPDVTDVTVDAGKIQNIKTNAASTGAIFYMISLLYQNAGFVLTNGVACFDAVCAVETTPGSTTNMHYTFTIKPTLDEQNNKVVLELTSYIAEANATQYSYIEMNFNFEEKELSSYVFYSWIDAIGGAVGMALTEDGDYLYNSAEANTDAFAVAVIECKDAFVNANASLEKLTTNLDAEMQVYFDALNKILAEING